MTLAPGDKIISIQTKTGPVLVEAGTLTPGQKCISIPTKTGPVDIPLGVLAPGDKVVSVPAATGNILVKVSAGTAPGILVMGGFDGTNALNDIWKSVDNGKIWTQMTASAGWSARYGHACVVLSDGGIILTGGYGGGYLNDTWYSGDGGATWVQKSATAAWSGRYSHGLCRLSDNTLILTGGHGSGNEGLQDVYQSTNLGVTWTQMTASAPWTRRNGHGSFAMADDSVIIFGGGYGTPFFLSDTWRSADQGANWTQLKPDNNIPYLRRTLFSSVLSGSDIIMMGGLKGYGIFNPYGNTNEVWISSDNGIDWTSLPAPGWTARRGHSSVLSGINLFVMGGYSTGYLNDVWRSVDNGVTWVLRTATPGWSARDSHSSVVLL